MKTYILTGGTGFLGHYLCTKLLDEGNRIIFLGRSKNGLSFKERIEKNIPSIGLGLAEYIETDFVEENSETLINKLAHIPKEGLVGVWHLAADLSFKSSDRNRVMRVNVEGIKNIVALCQYFKIPLFYISTAYVHGRIAGSAYEIYQEQPIFNNAYEESKFHSELIIKNTPDLDVIIFRPSILIDKNVYQLTNFGYYSFLISLSQLRKNLRINSETFLKVPFPIFYSSRALLNLMPIDVAVEWIYRISRDSGSKGKIFHICNPKPFLVGSVFSQTFKAFSISLPLIGVPKKIALYYISIISKIGTLLGPIKPVAKRLFYFKWYILEEVFYDMTNTKKIIGTDPNNFFNFPDDFIYHAAMNFKSKQDRT